MLIALLGSSGEVGRSALATEEREDLSPSWTVWGSQGTGPWRAELFLLWEGVQGSGRGAEEAKPFISRHRERGLALAQEAQEA